MTVVIPISKRGTVTLPPSFRKKLGLAKLANPMLLVEEKDGKLILEAATAVPVREIPKSKIHAWMAEDEKAMEAFTKAGTRKKK